jgi:DNA repair exonuclease SbcCD nuclease subunit
MVRFLQTSDWQLGMTRHFFSEGAQERYNQARFDAIRTLGKIASTEKCQFMTVCGDAFESNQVDQKTVARALEALREVPVPIYILPGNHDPLNEVSVYHSSVFTRGKPANIKVIDNLTPVQISDDVELVGAPWLSKRMVVNPFNEAIASLKPIAGVLRIVLAHGIVDSFTPKKDDPGVLTLENLDLVISNKMASFIALGDRHTCTKVGISERIWYSGTPEVTNFGEEESGYALVVELDGDRVITKPIRIGQWKFIEKDHVNINTDEDIKSLCKALDGLEQKEQTAIKMKLVGSVSLSQESFLQKSLETTSQVFGSFQLIDDGLLVLPNDADFSMLGFTGFAEATVNRLREKMSEGGDEKMTARNALMLLVRLGGGMS